MRRGVGVRGPQETMMTLARKRQAFGPQDAAGHEMCLLGKNSVTQGFEHRQPFFVGFQRYAEDALGARVLPLGVIQPLGTPIIHSTKDRATICLPDGLFSRPVNPYSKPIRHAPKLVAAGQVSFVRSKYPTLLVIGMTVGVGNNENPFP